MFKTLKNKALFITLFTAVVGVLLSLTIYTISKNDELKHIEAEFNRIFTAKAAAFERELALNISLLSSTASFYHASNHVDKDEFQTFTSKNLANKLGIKSIAWSKADYIEGKLKLPITYIEPIALFEHELNYDPLTIATVKDLILNNTQQHNMLSFSSPITPTENSNNAIITLGLPIYKKFGITQPQLLGYIFSELKIDIIFEQAVKKIHTKENLLNIWLVDSTNNDQILYQRIKEKSRTSHITLDYIINIGSHQWILRSTASADFIQARISFQPMVILTVSLLLTFLLTAYIFNVLRRQESIEHIISQRTFELEQSEKRLRTILDSTANGIIVINSQGFITLLNPAICTLFGYEESELIGQCFYKLLPAGSEQNHAAYLQHYNNENISDLGINIETQAHHKNGSEVPIHISITDLTYNNEIFYVCVILDISERIQNDKLKSEFISTVSHELRTPLTSINGSLKLILSQFPNLPSTAIELLRIADRNTERQLGLVNDLLDSQRLAAGKMQFSFEKIDLLDLTKTTIESIQSIGSKNNIHIKLYNKTENLKVNVDRIRLTQVITNILSNALKFSKNNSEVKVSIEQTDNFARLEVTDSGNGIPEDFRLRIFKRFSQADGSDQRQSSGTGLGLAISKDLIESMGGEIGYTSEIDKGSTFYIKIPVDK